MLDAVSQFREYMRLQRKRESDGLTVMELERWNSLKCSLNRRFQPDVSEPDADRRESVRLPSRIRLEYESYGELAPCLMTSMSRGGVFVAAPTPLPIGTKLTLRIDIQERDGAVEVPGEVVSHNLAADLKSEERGMGVRFGALSDEQQRAVDEIYRRAARTALEAEAKQQAQSVAEDGAGDGDDGPDEA